MWELDFFSVLMFKQCCSRIHSPVSQQTWLLAHITYFPSSWNMLWTCSHGTRKTNSLQALNRRMYTHMYTQPKGGAIAFLHCHWSKHSGSVKVVVWCLLFLFYRERRDTYYCMLFNDEVHTYEQVIYTLQKAVNCTQKEAVSFATTVDRDVSSLSAWL